MRLLRSGEVVIKSIRSKVDLLRALGEVIMKVAGAEVKSLHFYQRFAFGGPLKPLLRVGQYCDLLRLENGGAMLQNVADVAHVGMAKLPRHADLL